MRKELLIGCGSQRKKAVYDPKYKYFEDLITLDINKDHNPDVVHDLTQHPLPFFDNEFDEIHAYEVLEHLTNQGDYKFFFAEFSEYWRILKSGGRFYATVPSINSRWCWGDPSHKRVIMRETLTFLSQDEYKKQIGCTAMSDFRYIYKADFRILHCEETDLKTIFVLEAIK